MRSAFPTSAFGQTTDGQIAWYCRELGPHIRLLTAGDLIGASIVVPRPDEACAWLELLAVAPGQQGRGTGRRLLDLAELATSAAGLPCLELAVDMRNHGAIRFYERQGYERVTAASQGQAHEAPKWRYAKGLGPATFAPSGSLGLQPAGSPPPIHAFASRILFRALGVRGQGLTG